MGWLTAILGFAGKQVTGYFDDRRDYRRSKNEMAANGLGTFGGGFIVVTWLSPLWVGILEALFPTWLGGASSQIFSILDSLPPWYTGTAITISLGAFGADTVAKLPKAWSKGSK